MGETSLQEKLEEKTLEIEVFSKKLECSVSQPENSINCISNVTSNATSQTTTHKPERKYKKTKMDDSLEVKNIKNVATQSTVITVNEFIIFGQHVAIQLQCLPLEDALKLQEDIQRLITSARLRSL